MQCAGQNLDIGFTEMQNCRKTLQKLMLANITELMKCSKAKWAKIHPQRRKRLIKAYRK